MTQNDVATRTSPRRGRLRKLRRTAVAAVAAVAVIALSGCADDIFADSAAQPDQIGPAVVTTKVCEWGGFNAITQLCTGSLTTTGPSVQALVAYQVPPTVTPPDSFQSQMTGGNTRTLTYQRSQSYSDSLQAIRPAATGMMWVGYLSDTQAFAPGPVSGTVETISAPFALPRSDSGAPFHGSFSWLTINGEREVTVAHVAGRAVDCTESGTACYAAGPLGGGTPVALPTVQQIATSDFGLTPAPPQVVQAGSGLDVPVPWAMAGPAIGTPFNLSAASDIPGAGAAPADPTLNPGGDSTGSEVVHLLVPRSAPPGDYHMTLTAALPNGQTRTATTLVHVTPAPDITPPTLTIGGVKNETLADALKNGMNLDLSCSEPCKLGVTLAMNFKTAHGLGIAAAKKPVTIGRKTVTLAKAGHVKVRVRMSKKARKRLRNAKSLTLTVIVLGRDASGNVATKKKTLKLR